MRGRDRKGPELALLAVLVLLAFITLWALVRRVLRRLHRKVQSIRSKSGYALHAPQRDRLSRLLIELDKAGLGRVLRVAAWDEQPGYEDTPRLRRRRPEKIPPGPQPAYGDTEAEPGEGEAPGSDREHA